jgi:mRNA interferase MazF
MLTENVYDFWNHLKKTLETKSVYGFPNEKEIWICSLGKNLGYEQDGKGEKFSRPVLVLKKFNNNAYWVVPLSSKHKTLDFYHNYQDGFGNQASAILLQMKMCSPKRFLRKAGVMSDKEFGIIKDKIKAFLD